MRRGEAEASWVPQIPDATATGGRDVLEDASELGEEDGDEEEEEVAEELRGGG